MCVGASNLNLALSDGRNTVKPHAKSDGGDDLRAGPNGGEWGSSAELGFMSMESNKVREHMEYTERGGKCALIRCKDWWVALIGRQGR